jgi:hypothetical protein
MSIERRYYIRTPDGGSDLVQFKNWHQAFQTVLKMDKKLFDEALARFKVCANKNLDQDDWIFWNGQRLLDEFGYRILPIVCRTDKAKASLPRHPRVDHN